jgi:hypothetical protein
LPSHSEFDRQLHFRDITMLFILTFHHYVLSVQHMHFLGRSIGSHLYCSHPCRNAPVFTKTTNESQKGHDCGFQYDLLIANAGLTARKHVVVCADCSPPNRGCKIRANGENLRAFFSLCTLDS